MCVVCVLRGETKKPKDPFLCGNVRSAVTAALYLSPHGKLSPLIKQCTRGHCLPTSLAPAECRPPILCEISHARNYRDVIAQSRVKKKS